MLTAWGIQNSEKPESRPAWQLVQSDVRAEMPGIAALLLDSKPKPRAAAFYPHLSRLTLDTVLAAARATFTHLLFLSVLKQITCLSADTSTRNADGACKLMMNPFLLMITVCQYSKGDIIFLNCWHIQFYTLIIPKEFYSSQRFTVLWCPQPAKDSQSGSVTIGESRGLHSPATTYLCLQVNVMTYISTSHFIRYICSASNYYKCLISQSYGIYSLLSGL